MLIPQHKKTLSGIVCVRYCTRSQSSPLWWLEEQGCGHAMASLPMEQEGELAFPISYQFPPFQALFTDK